MIFKIAMPKQSLDVFDIHKGDISNIPKYGGFSLTLFLRRQFTETNTFHQGLRDTQSTITLIHIDRNLPNSGTKFLRNQALGDHTIIQIWRG